MKKSSLFVLSLFLFSGMEAAILRVNNNNGVVGNYTTVQNAHNAANAGDTIYVEPSSSGYGNLTATKQLVWIGPGYFLDPANSGNSGLQFHTQAGQCTTVTFSSGSAGSVFMGIQFSTITVNTNNITITRCYGSSVTLNTSSSGLTANLTISQCILYGSTSITESFGSPTTGTAILNNIILGNVTISGSNSGMVVNGNYLNAFSSNAFVFSNNIVYNTTGVICVYPSNVYNNLFCVANNLNYVGSNGNLFTSGNPTVATNSVFVGGTNSGYDSWSVLKAGSPALGAGYGGIDIGPRGGVSPYKSSGIPAVPTISQFQFRSTPVNTLPITISTRSNN